MTHAHIASHHAHTHNPTNSWDPYNIIVGYSLEYSGRGSGFVEENLTVVQISLYNYYVIFALEYDQAVSIRLTKNSSPYNIFLETTYMSVTYESFT